MLCVSLLGFYGIIVAALAVGYVLGCILTKANTSELLQENNFYQEMIVIKDREIKGYETQFGVIHFDDEGNVITDDIPIRSN